MSMKLLYKPFGLLVGVVGGLVAARAFERVWGLVGREGKAPAATELNSSWPEVVIASAMKGAVFGAVKAATDRAGVAGFARVTGTWAGKDSSAKPKAK